MILLLFFLKYFFPFIFFGQATWHVGPQPGVQPVPSEVETQSLNHHLGSSILVSFLTFILKLHIVNKIHLLLFFTILLVLTPGGSVVKNLPEMQETWV